MSNLGDAALDMADNIKDAFSHLDLDNAIFPLVSLLQMLLVSLRKNRPPFIKPKQTFNETYDYVIVGAGTAGSVLANRLTEISCLSVLVLEAGDEPPIFTDIPSFARVFYGSAVDWNYRTTPQEHGGFGQNENRAVLNMGKALGGSSILNSMEAVRGNKENYDQWAAEGATGWSYDEVFPYFLKLEDNRNIDELDAGYHRTGGPMTCETINYTPEHKQPVIDALADMGYKLRDVNGERQLGAFDLQMSARHQERWGTDRGYLDPVRRRRNLDVLTNALARKILIGENKTAYGVEFDHKGETHRVRARREVLVANGGLKTPQLLMLSGIGPREELEKLGIEVVADLPVGKNLMDHIAGTMIYSVSKTIMGPVLKTLNPVNILDYIHLRKGPLCAPTQVFLVAFLDGVNNTNSKEDSPLQQLIFGEYDVVDLKMTMNVKDEVFDSVYKPYAGRATYVCYALLLQPKSRGQVTLNSTDPYEMPIIDPNYLYEESDVRTMVEGMKACNAIARHPALRKIKAEPLKTVYPACEDVKNDEDEYLACSARQIIATIWHYSGTAKMGRINDTTSVVGPDLKVIGVNNLRVVNAAIFPIVPSGNTNIPAVMVGEKASDMIKKDIRCE